VYMSTISPRGGRLRRELFQLKLESKMVVDEHKVGREEVWVISSLHAYSDHEGFCHEEFLRNSFLGKSRECSRMIRTSSTAT